MLTTYADYHQWLFPGDPVVPVENPISASATTQEILEEVSCRTGISVDWLKRAVREVLEGLAGLHCLWFLHGASGRIRSKPLRTTSLGVPEGMAGPGVELTVLIKAYRDKQYSKLLSRPRPVILDYEARIDWEEGVLRERVRYTGPDETLKPKKRVTRLRRWLRRQRASKKLIEAFEKRTPSFYTFLVSTNPLDILTMSHGRSWAYASCMRPGGMFPYGPLTDMAAGSAIVWFFRADSNKPVGRVLLRPYLTKNGNPAIATGGRLYGMGPDTSIDSLNASLEPWLGDIKIKAVKICSIGKNGRALTRAIYSDIDLVSGGCKQDLEEYHTAYANLKDAPWPRPLFEPDELAEAARRRAKKHEWRTKEEERAAEEEIYEASETLLHEAEEWIDDWYFDSQPDMMMIWKNASDNGALEDLARDFFDNAIDNDLTGRYNIFRGDQSYDESIVGDAAEFLRRKLLESLEENTEYVAVVTLPEDAEEYEQIIQRIRNYSPLIVEIDPKLMLDHHPDAFAETNLEWDKEAGVARDEDTKEEVTSVLVMPDWVFEEEKHVIEDEAIHVDEVVDIETVEGGKINADTWFSLY